MTITFDFSFYWVCVGAVTTVLAGMWAFNKSRSALFGR